LRLAGAVWLPWAALACSADVPPSAATPAALAAQWSGLYDLTEEIIVADPRGLSLSGGGTTRRLQMRVRPISIPALGSQLLYLEEFPYGEPDAVRRQVLMALESVAGDATADVRVRQFTRKPSARSAGAAEQLSDDFESLPGCDLWLRHDGHQFRGGTRGNACLVPSAAPADYIDYQIVIGDHLLWYRRRILDLATDDLMEEVAGYRYFELEGARLYNCRVSWSPDQRRAMSREISAFDLHDQGGRARFETPDGRDYELELHGRDWPASPADASLILQLFGLPAGSEPLASSWTSSRAPEIGLDIGSVAIVCRPVVAETGEDRS